MLKWYKKLYVSEEAKKHKRRTIARINHKKLTMDAYVITLPANDKNLMDIVSANVLLQNINRERCPLIIGLAKGKDDAYELVKDIVMETYEKTGNFCVKEYIENR